MIPISYKPGFIAEPGPIFKTLWEHLAWERRENVPRREFYCNDAGVPYTYGRGAGQRTYEPAPWTPELLAIRVAVEAELACRMEVCFLNGYADSKDALGWHSDDSPEMDDERPIAIVTFGAEREIWFSSLAEPADITRLRLGSGSLCVMAAGMQITHRHKIPKSDRECGPRISLTFRGYTAPAS